MQNLQHRTNHEDNHAPMKNRRDEMPSRNLGFFHFRLVLKETNFLKFMGHFRTLKMFIALAGDHDGCLNSKANRSPTTGIRKGHHLPEALRTGLPVSEEPNELADVREIACSQWDFQQMNQGIASNYPPKITGLWIGGTSSDSICQSKSPSCLEIPASRLQRIE
jgi:hypothetical protein